jgi:hypothetical protein
LNTGTITDKTRGVEEAALLGLMDWIFSPSEAHGTGEQDDAEKGGQAGRAEMVRLVADRDGMVPGAVDHHALEGMVDRHDRRVAAVDRRPEITRKMHLGENRQARTGGLHVERRGVFREPVARGGRKGAAAQTLGQGAQGAVGGEVALQRRREGPAVAGANLPHKIRGALVGGDPVCEKARGQAVGLSKTSKSAARASCSPAGGRFGSLL